MSSLSYLRSAGVVVRVSGEAHSLKVEKFLFEGKSDYQDVVVFEVLGLLLMYTCTC